MVEPLETTVNKESNRYFRRFLADTFTSVSFGIVVGGANELLIAGLSWEQTVASRAMNSVTNTLFGRPYGKYRDFLFRKLKINENSGFVRKFVGDVLAFGSFWTPIYGGVLYVAGADYEQVAAACTSLTLLSPAIGRPYGLYLNTVRTCFGVTPEYMEK